MDDNTRTSLSTPLATLMGSVSSWSARTGPEPFTREERMEMARRVAAAKVWTCPEDQDDSEDGEANALRAKGAEHMQRLRDQAMALSWEDLGFEGLTDELIEDMLEHIRETCASTTAAAVEVGLDPGLLRRWLQEGKRLQNEASEVISNDPILYARRKRLMQLAMAITKAQNDPVNAAAKTIVTQARQGDSDAAKFILLNSPKGAAQWGRKSEVRHRGKVEHTLQPPPGTMGHLRGLSVKELEAKLQLENDLTARPSVGPGSFGTRDVTVDAEFDE